MNPTAKIIIINGQVVDARERMKSMATVDTTKGIPIVGRWVSTSRRQGALIVRITPQPASPAPTGTT